MKYTKWKVGDGSNIDLWKDWWCLDEPLGNLFPGEHTDNQTRVDSIILNGEWDLTTLEHLVPDNVRLQIKKTPINANRDCRDIPVWTLASDGRFHVSSLSNRDNSCHPKWIWRWIWKMKWPNKLRHFIWLVAINKLPTNLLRSRRGGL